MSYFPSNGNYTGKQNRAKDRTLGFTIIHIFRLKGILINSNQQRQEGNHCRAEPEVSTLYLGLLIRILWSTPVSKAAMRSNSTKRQHCPVSESPLILFSATCYPSLPLQATQPTLPVCFFLVQICHWTSTTHLSSASESGIKVFVRYVSSFGQLSSEQEGSGKINDIQKNKGQEGYNNLSSVFIWIAPIHNKSHPMTLPIEPV